MPLEIKVSWWSGEESSPETIRAAYGSEANGFAVGRDLGDALAIEAAPGPFAKTTSNGEIATADDGRIGGGFASALDLAGVAGVEAEGAERAVFLNKFHADDGGASVEDELTDEGGFIHGGNAEAPRGLS